MISDHNRVDRIRTESGLPTSSHDPDSVHSFNHIKLQETPSNSVISIGAKLQDNHSNQSTDSQTIKQNNNKPKPIMYISLSINIFVFLLSIILYSTNTINGIALLMFNLCIILLCIFISYYLYKSLNKYEIHIHSLQNRIYELENYVNQIQTNTQINMPKPRNSKPSLSHKSSLPTIPQHIYNPYANNSNTSHKFSNQSVDLLQGFRNGQLSHHLNYCITDDLVSMLPLISMCITLLPFGMNTEKENLLNILKQKTDANKFFAQQMHYFLFSYFNHFCIRSLYQKNKIMKYVMQTINYYENHRLQNNNKLRTSSNHQPNVSQINWLEITENPLMYDNKGGSLTPQSINNDNNNKQLNIINKFPKYDPALNEMELDEKLNIEYDDKDPIRLYRLAIDKQLNEGCYINITEKYFNHFYDPIYGTPNVQKLFIKKQLNSNAKPYLIECYSAENGYINKLKLCSSFILKQGDDLRKDAAVLQMFRFMNLLWKENNCLAHVLCYKCIPLGNDIGIIELIANCIELKHINNMNDELLSQNINNLIYESAGSYIASFILGIRDRHDENILIRESDCTLFHIDFGFLFGEKAGNNMVYGGDTAKLAITSNLQKIMNKYKHNGWDEFVNLAIDAWCILRQNYKEIVDFTKVLFGFTKSVDEIDEFLKNALKINKTDIDAINYIRSKLIHAPKKLKTKIKNKVHNIAQQIKM